jgi:hypothetical protein
MKGIGDATLEKGFHFIINYKHIEQEINFEPLKLPKEENK